MAQKEKRPGAEKTLGEGKEGCSIKVARLEKREVSSKRNLFGHLLRCLSSRMGEANRRRLGRGGREVNDQCERRVIEKGTVS